MHIIIDILNKYSQCIQAVSAVAMIAVTIAIGRFTKTTSEKQVKITNMQTELAEQSIKIELYKQRIEMYKKLEDIIIQCLLGINIDDNNSPLKKLGEIRTEVGFLFGQEIQEYVVDIINKATILSNLVRARTLGEEYQSISKWFNNQVDENRLLRKKFAPYLDLGTYGIPKGINTYII